MIHETKDQLVSMGFTEMEQFEDDFGTTGYGVRFMGDDYILVAKEYAHDGLASFLASLVLSDPGVVDYIFYNKDTDTFTVFDGEYLAEHSERSKGPSKQRECLWRELPLECGAELDAYIRGDERPKTLAGDNETLETFI